MNRNGNLGIVLLVLIAFISVGSGLFVMVGFNGDVGKTRAELRTFADKSVASHEFLLENFRSLTVESIENAKVSSDFYATFRDSFRSKAEEKRASGLNTNLYSKIATGDYLFSYDGKTYEVVISDIFESYTVANNEIKYHYSLKVLFDKEGITSLKVLFDKEGITSLNIEESL